MMIIIILINASDETLNLEYLEYLEHLLNTLTRTVRVQLKEKYSIVYCMKMIKIFGPLESLPPPPPLIRPFESCILISQSESKDLDSHQFSVI